MPTGESDPIRWALVGFGSGGRVFHAPLLASAPGVDLVAVVTSDPGRRAAVAADYPGVRCVSGLADLVDLGVRAVTITTPPVTHVPLAEQAVTMGLHAVVDKPFALTAAEARHLVETARAHRVLVVPYVNRRWDNDFLTALALMRDGRLGAVHRLTSRIDRARPVKPGWPSDASRGGGVLLDLGPHLVDQALRLLGDAVEVYAELDTRRASTRTAPPTAEDDMALHLTHASGARSTLVAGLASPAAGPRFLLQGSRAGLRIDGFDVQEAQLKKGGTPEGLGEEWGVDVGASAWLTGVGADGAGGDAERLPLRRGRWDLIYPGVADAIRGVADPPVDAQDAIATAAVLDAARISALQRRVVPIE